MNEINFWNSIFLYVSGSPFGVLYIWWVVTSQDTHTFGMHVCHSTIGLQENLFLYVVCMIPDKTLFFGSGAANLKIFRNV